MKTDEFFLEEYKSLRGEIRANHTAYSTLEIATFGGAVAVYGWLLGLNDKTPASPVPGLIWWGLFALIGMSFVRCAAHYLVIRKLALYVAGMEEIAYSRGPVLGFERYHKTAGLRPILFQIVTFGSWATLLLFAAFVALNQGIP
jgi:hypothetical protein